MNGKQAKRARAEAYKAAEAQGIWKKGENSVFNTWWRKILARVSLGYRRERIDAVGHWYKRVLKDFSRQAYAYIHDRDAQSSARAQARARRKRNQERIRVIEKGES